MEGGAGRGCGRVLGHSEEMDSPERSKIGGTPLSKFEVILIRCPFRQVSPFFFSVFGIFFGLFRLICRGSGSAGLCGGFDANLGF